ncbi:hypothetical protein ABK040_006815 [Willaertia magna]
MDMTKPLTSQQIQQYVALLKKWKSEGKDLNDPQYKLLHQFLKQQVQKQNGAKLQQQQLYNNTVLNQTNPPLSSVNPQTLSGGSVFFTQQQKERLKAQIYAFKHHITRREPNLPQSLIQAIAGQNVEANLKEYETTYIPNLRHQTTPPPNTTNTQNQQPTMHPSVHPTPTSGGIVKMQSAGTPVSMNNATPPPININNNTNPSNVHNKVTQGFSTAYSSMGIIPPASTGNEQRQQSLDLQTLYKERERRIQHKMKRRYETLKSKLQSGNPIEQLRAVIEIKQFQLLKPQKELRAEIIKQVKTQTQTPVQPSYIQKTQTVANEQQTTNAVQKKTTKKPAATTIKTNKKVLLNEITQKKKKIKDYIKNDIKKPIEKVNKELVQFFEKKAKAEKEKRQKAEKARLKALKENDEEAYFKLLEQTKEGRLTELIKQTDECLRSLGASLVSERGTDEEEVEEHDSDDEGERSSIFRKYLLNQNKYYKVAHKLVEKVEKQPTILRGGDLKAYQLQGLQWLVSLYNNRLNGILADEMGLGKTIQTISLLSYLYEFKNNKGPHLIIVPLSTMENWVLEFEKWCPTLRLIKYAGSPQSRKAIQNGAFKDKNFEVCVTQYEYISRDKKHLKKIQWNYIIIDEGHRIKNSDCKLVKNLMEYNSRNRLLLTGTPLQNDLKELWALLHFLLPKIFDSSVNFEHWFNSPFSATGEKLSQEMTEEETLLIIHRLHQVLRPFLLRREKTEVEEQLPEKSEKIIYVELSSLQKQLYRSIQDKNSIMINGKAKKSFNNVVMQLRKVCNHPFLFDFDTNPYSDEEYYDLLIRSSGKFELLDRILPKLKRCGHRVLLFSQMTQLLDIMEEFLTHRDYKYMRLDGNVKHSDRGTLIKDFNASNSPYFVFLLSTRSGGLGLNLQTADTVIIFDSDWNPQQDLQAMARAHRIGQTKSVLVLTLCTNTQVEEKIRERAQEKRDAEAKVIKAGKFNQKSTILERQELLETLLKKETAFKKHETPDDIQLNNILARTDDEYELFLQMDKEREVEMEEYWKNRGFKQKKPRLLGDDELPDWVQEIKEEDEEDEESLGRGRRKRKQVQYNEDEVIVEGSDSDSEEEEEEEEEEDNKKRKRKPTSKKQEQEEEVKKKKTKKTSKKKEVEQEEETPNQELGYTHDGIPYDQIIDQLSSDIQKKLFTIFKDIGTVCDDGRAVALPFLELPDRKSFPDYYDIIGQPICLNTIEQKIRNGMYKTFDDMERDINLLVANAQKYNQEGSDIYNDAATIRELFIKRKKEFSNYTQDLSTSLNNNSDLDLMADDVNMGMDDDQNAGSDLPPF